MESLRPVSSIHEPTNSLPRGREAAHVTSGCRRCIPCTSTATSTMLPSFTLLVALKVLLVCARPLQYRDPQTYFAFIVGTSAYMKERPLPKSVNDAEDVRDTLLGAGYPPDHVVTVLDGTHRKLQEELAAFTRRLDGAEGCRVVLFYAGRGVEGAGGESILLPIDADVSSEYCTPSASYNTAAFQFESLLLLSNWDSKLLAAYCALCNVCRCTTHLHHPQ